MARVEILATASASPVEHHNNKKYFAFQKIGTLIVILSSVVICLTIGLIQVNHWRTSYTILSSGSGEDITYIHEDERTTNIVNYLTGEGEFPKEERLPVYRQHIKNMLEKAKMPVPDDIYTMEYKELNALAIKQYKLEYPNHPKSQEELQARIEKLFEDAVRPPLEGFGPDVDGKIWRLLIDVGSPKIRWMEEQDELPARIVAYSGGDKISFYDPVGHTIYISYNMSAWRLLDEVAHAKQFRENQIRSWTRLFKLSVVSFIRTNGDTKKFLDCYKDAYNDPRSIEGEAHGADKELLLKTHGLRIVSEKAPPKESSTTIVEPNPRTCGDSFKA